MVRNLIYTLLILSLSQISLAQSKFGEIRGKVVYNIKRTPIDSVLIQLKKNNKIIFEDITDEDGYFIFKNVLPDSNYILRAEKIGYDIINIKKLEVISDEISFQNFKLSNSIGKRKEINIKRQKPLKSCNGG